MEGVHRILDGVGKQGLGRILDEVCRIFEGVARCLAPHTQQLQEDKDQTALARSNASDAVVAVTV